jgi:hypothetical protein
MSNASPSEDQVSPPFPRTSRNMNWAVYDAYAESILRKDALYSAILDPRPVQRLRSIRFLGALDYFNQHQSFPNRSHQNRYRHSIGVAYLTARACSALSAPPASTRMLVSAALLHDVGHGALSHSIEPYFKKRFNVCHKHFGNRIVQGDLFLGTELREILGDFSIEATEAVALISGTSRHAFRFLFSHPINVDTLDGIVRSASFFSRTASAPAPDEFLMALIKRSPISTRLGDSFWGLKDRIYNSFIHARSWALYDYVVQIALDHAGSKVGTHHFLLTDDEFFSSFRAELTSALSRMKRSLNELEYELALRYDFGKRTTRRFIIDPRVEPSSLEAADKRYAIERSC